MRTSDGLRILAVAMIVLAFLLSCASVAVATASSGTQNAASQTASKEIVSGKGAAKEGISQKGTSADAGRKQGASKEGVKMMLKKIHWLGHDGFRIDSENVIYFDPLELKQGATPADIILITHPHYDHCSPKDVAKIQKKGTVIVTTADCAEKLSGDIKIVKPGDTITVKGVKIEAVPAYNVDKTFHTKDKGWVGYIVTVDGTKIYHAGDTDLIPEMKTFKVDIAFLPVSGKYVMTAEEAAKAADAIKPQMAIPMHYGVIKDLGSSKDAVTFKEKTTVPVEILKLEK